MTNKISKIIVYVEYTLEGVQISVDLDDMGNNTNLEDDFNIQYENRLLRTASSLRIALRIIDEKRKELENNKKI